MTSTYLLIGAHLLCSDTQAEHDACSIEHPGYIMLADRTEMITLKMH
jgi:hypothetical protein